MQAQKMPIRHATVTYLEIEGFAVKSFEVGVANRGALSLAHVIGAVPHSTRASASIATVRFNCVTIMVNFSVAGTSAVFWINTFIQIFV